MPQLSRALSPLPALICLAAGLGLAGPAWSIGSVTDGGVSFGYSVDFATSPGNTVNADFTGAAAGDQLFESWWFFRVAGDGQETAFGAPDAEDYTLHGGTTGRLDWNDPGGSGLFSAALGVNVIETAPGEGVVFQNLTVTNTGLTNLDIDLFHYTDLDLSGTWRRDGANLVASPDGIEMLITDSQSGATAPFIGYDADAFRVSDYRALLDELTDGGVTDLDGSGLPFASGGGNDFTGAFQWSVTIGVGDSMSFLTQFGSNATLQDPSVSTVPEPGPAVLALLGLIGLATYGRDPR